jgi:DNA helicase-2/ATP-dependent DNA helicase PcrA
MKESEIDLLTIQRGLVVAPAGCGKTQLICDALARHNGRKPILVLTHTNAGVGALRNRLAEAGVSPASYRLATLDGWALRLATTFPERSGYGATIPAQPDYPAIRKAAYGLIKEGHIADTLRASYAKLLVDEYQDCSICQHAIVYYAAMVLPTCILGDPLQAIFDFGNDKLAEWEKHVCAHFPLVAELNRPWRWINAKTEALGNWILDFRKELLAGNPIDLRLAPKEVTWIPLDGSAEDHTRRSNAAKRMGKDSEDRVLVIGDSKNADGRHQIASQILGATVVEPVDLKDMVAFAGTFNLTAPNALAKIVYFAETIMSNVGAKDLLNRVQSFVERATGKELSNIEEAAIAFNQHRSYRAVASLLSALSSEPCTNIYRPAVLHAILRTLELTDGTQGLSLHEAAIRVREQNRMLGRPIPKRAIGSTLLLKGLEAECVVILNGDDLNSRNLYVAMTRGSKSIIVCSRSPILNPSR